MPNPNRRFIQLSDALAASEATSEATLPIIIDLGLEEEVVGVGVDTKVKPKNKAKPEPP
jgi:hypothetical protein